MTRALKGGSKWGKGVKLKKKEGRNVCCVRGEVKQEVETHVVAMSPQTRDEVMVNENEMLVPGTTEQT